MTSIRAVLGASAVVAATALTVSSASGAATANWTQERSGAAHRAWNKTEVTLTVNNVKNLKPGWGGWEIYNSSVNFEPIVVDTRLYLVQEDLDFGAQIEAKTVADAAKVWKWQRYGNPSSPPVYANGKVYWLVQGWPGYASNPNNDGNRSLLYALDPATGAVIWKVDATTGHGVGWADANLTVEGNLAVTTSRLSNGRTVYTFWNATTGAVIKEGAYQGATALGTTGAAISDGTVYLVADRLIALSLTGAVKWTSDTVPYAPLDPVATSDLVYVPGKYQVRAVKASTGALKFAIYSGGEIAVDANRIYKVSYKAGPTVSQLEAFDRWTGARAWSRNLPAGAAPWGQAPTVANGVVFTVQTNGLGAYAASNGSPLWLWAGFAEGRVVVANGKVYVTGSSGVRQFRL
jgi:hypothetical protein